MIHNGLFSSICFVITNSFRLLDPWRIFHWSGSMGVNSVHAQACTCESAPHGNIRHENFLIRLSCASMINHFFSIIFLLIVRWLSKKKVLTWSRQAKCCLSRSQILETPKDIFCLPCFILYQVSKERHVCENLLPAGFMVVFNNYDSKRKRLRSYELSHAAWDATNDRPFDNWKRYRSLVLYYGNEDHSINSITSKRNIRCKFSPLAF